MKIEFFIIFICLPITTLISQNYSTNNEIKGIVKVQNSDNKRLSEVKVSPYFEQANHCYSDLEGRFLLKFPHKSVGDHVVIEVEKHGYKWVNEESTRTIVIPKSKNDYVLVIVMSEPETFRRNANKILEERLKSLKLAHEKKLLEIIKKYSKDTATFQREIRFLNGKFEKQKARSQELALRFAKVDLDEASNLYRNVYDYFMEGQLDSALLFMDDQKMKVIFENTIDLKRNVNHQIKQAVEVFKLKGEMHLQNLEYEKAAEAYKKVTLLLEDHEASAINLGLQYDYQFLGQIYLDLEDYDLSIYYLEKAILFLKTFMGPSHPDLSKVFEKKNYILRRKNQKSSTIDFQQNLEEILISFPDSINTWEELNLMSISTNQKGDLAEAIIWGEKSIKQAEVEFGVFHENYAVSLNNLAQLYNKLRLYEKADSLFLEIGHKSTTGDSLNYLTSKDTIFLTVGANNEKIFEHKLGKKQTLFSMAKFYGLSVGEVYFYNPVLSEKPLKVGHKIRIPIPNRAILRYKTENFEESRHIPVYYVVKKGDTMYRICKDYFRMPLEDILDRNDLDTYGVKTGQLIRIGWLNIDGIPESYRQTSVGPLANRNNALKTLFIAESQSKKEKEHDGVAFWQRNTQDDSDLDVLHRIAPINSIISITSPTTRRTVYAKVSGKIPNTTYEKNIIVVVSPLVAKLLGAKDPKFFVKVKYFD